MTDPYMVLTPDFVIVGCTNDRGVRLLASTELTKAELECHLPEKFYADLIAPPERGRVVIEMTVGMKRFKLVDAPTWAEAFRHLFDEWAPNVTHPPKALPASPRQVGLTDRTT